MFDFDVLTVYVLNEIIFYNCPGNSWLCIAFKTFFHVI